MTELTDTIESVLADPLEAAGHCALVDRLTEEHGDARDALLVLVKLHPENDAPRLAFAELFERNGQPDRAEFIRVQCQLAREMADWKTATPATLDMYLDPQDREAQAWKHMVRSLSDREHDLWNFGGSGHWAVDDLFPFAFCIRCIDDETISKSVTTYDPIAIYRRGFVDQITCFGGDWVRHSGHILTAHPVTKVTLTRWPEIQVHHDQGRCQMVFQVSEALPGYVVSDSQLMLSGAEAVIARGHRRTIELAWPGITFTFPA